MNKSNLANGRSSSQRSIHDYPEHLNPFYEDENHKRLRFWKLGSNKTNRSNSFSIDGLKGLWSFKTFKLKKRSSVLGINKTSESPPLPRRNDEDRYGSQTTYDGSMRHTVDIGLGNQFQRGGCRSSLQDLNSISRNHADNSFFVRNNRYRSTVQPGPSGYSQTDRYQNSAAGTPVYRSRFNQQPPLSRGSSQLSVNSTNPFDDEFETISQAGSPDRASIRRSGRKKRRAPSPPKSPIKNNVPDEIDELNDTVKISNLTAEIETFVRNVDTESERIQPEQTHAEEATALKLQENYIENEETSDERQEKSKTSRQSPESNDYYPHEEHIEQLTLEKIVNLGTTDFNSNERCKKSPVKIIIRAPTDEEPALTIVEEANAIAPRELDHKDEDDEQEEVLVIEQVEINGQSKENVTESKLTNGDAESKEEGATGGEAKMEETKVDREEQQRAQEEIAKEEIAKEKIETSQATIITETIQTTNSAGPFEIVAPIEQKLEIVEMNELKITESTEDLDKIVSKSDANPVEEEVPKREFARVSYRNGPIRQTSFEVEYVPIRVDSLKRNKNTNGSDGVKKVPPPPPQRRRSVKDIIESINKCQSLLKVNQDVKVNKAEKEKMNSDLFEASTSSFKTFKSTFDRNVNDLAGKQYQTKKLFNDVSEVNNNVIREDMSNIPVFVEKFNEFNNNSSNGIYDKYAVRDENRFSEGNVSKLEWNPVPKPRRHRHSTQGSLN